MTFSIASSRIWVDEESKRIGKLVLNQRGTPPSLAILQIGDNPASNKYIRHKQKKIADLGWISEYIKLEEPTVEKLTEILQEIKTDGITAYLPVALLPR